ncbi:MAG: DUF362 domain-containing protein [Candidatus Thorarchaeota archaeon]
MTSVALVKFKDSLKSTLSAGLDFIGGFSSLKSPILIKPNICTISDATGSSVTDVRVVEAITRLILEEDQGLVVKIVESDSQSKYAEAAFEKFGYADLERSMKKEGFDVSVVNLSKSPLIKADFKGRYFDKPELPGLLVNPHYFVSVAASKTHYLTTITGSLKNQFGVLPRKDQAFYHSDIDNVVIDLNSFIQPDLCIVDARVGVEGWNGPKTRRLDAFIIGRKPASVDATMARIMGFEPGEIPHILESSQLGLGNINPTVLGEAIESVQVALNLPK